MPSRRARRRLGGSGEPRHDDATRAVRRSGSSGHARLARGVPDRRRRVVGRVRRGRPRGAGRPEPAGLSPPPRPGVAAGRSRVSMPASGPIPPARVADVACGAGWSAIGIARAYPKVRVDGLDLDAPSIELAPGQRGEGRARGPRHHGRPRRRRPCPGGPVRSRHDLRVAPRHVAPRRRPARVPAAPRAGRLGAGRRRAGGGRLRRPGDQVERLMYWLQRPLLPPEPAWPTSPRRPPAR